MASTKRGPGRPAHIGPAILLALKANPGQTVRELNTNMPMILTLQNKGLVTKSGQRVNVNAEGKTTKGRPQSEFKLTLQGYDRVKSILAKQAKAEVEVSEVA